MLSEVSKDFGLRIDDVLTGKTFAESIIKGLKNLVKVSQTKPKNPFEETVTKSVLASTDAALPNFSLAFDHPPEAFEYDILTPFGPVTLDLEVKDFDQVKEETHRDYDTLKSKLIMNPSDKAKRINATPFIITKGFPERELSQMKELATSRGVLMADETSYQQEFERFVIGRVLNMAIGPSTIFRRALPGP